MLYTLTRSLQERPLEVWTQHKLSLYLTLNNSTLNERWLRFKFAISYHVGSNTMSKNQFKQKLNI